MAIVLPVLLLLADGGCLGEGVSSRLAFSSSRAALEVSESCHGDEELLGRERFSLKPAIGF